LHYDEGSAPPTWQTFGLPHDQPNTKNIGFWSDNFSFVSTLRFRAEITACIGYTSGILSIGGQVATLGTVSKGLNE